MTPYYVTHHNQCTECEVDILIGYEAILHDGLLFCTKECVKKHLYEMESPKEVYVTDDKIYRSWD